MNTLFICTAMLAAALLAAPRAQARPQPHAHSAMPDLSGAGRAGQAQHATRTIVLGMTDSMRFAPARVTLERGQTVKFVARNEGKLLHEIVLGTRAEIRQHRTALQRDPDLAHSAPYMAHVAPGASGQIVWRVERRGTFEFACLLPGHYEAGMSGTIVVR